MTDSSQFDVKIKPGLSLCIKQSYMPDFMYNYAQANTCTFQIISIHIRVVSLLTRIMETDHLLRPVPTFPGSIPVAGFRPGKPPSDRPHAYSVGHAGLFTPFRLRPALTDGLCGPGDLSLMCCIQFSFLMRPLLSSLRGIRGKGQRVQKLFWNPQEQSPISVLHE